MANSFKQMKNNGTLKRTDSGMFIKLADIHVQEGFNKRVDDERTQAADDDLFNHLSSGKPVPPLEVRPRDEGGVWIVEGHRRHRAYLRCHDAGKPVEWIAILPFTGSDVERIARIMNSNSQLALTPYEQSQVVKELAGFNLSPDEIAALVGKSRSTVDKLLTLTQANHDVQTLVKDGAVAVDAAVERVKEHGEFVKFSDYEALVSELASSRQINAQTLQVKLGMADTIKELEGRVNALAVENAALKESLDSICDAYNEGLTDLLDIAVKMAVNLQTPATFAALAAIEARGVEKAIERLMNMFASTGHIGIPVMALEGLAKELREAK